MKRISMPRVVAMARHPSLTYAGFATGLSFSGIECMLITATTTDAVAVLRDMGMTVDIEGTRAVGVMSRDDLEVLE